MVHSLRCPKMIQIVLVDRFKSHLFIFICLFNFVLDMIIIPSVVQRIFISRSIFFCIVLACVEGTRTARA